MAKKMIECALAVYGDCTEVNGFDAAFRGGTPPKWSDRPEGRGTGYTLNALRPVPEEVERRGHGTAGHLWCSEYWGSAGDLTRLSVRRGFKERVYRFFTPEAAPDDVMRYASYFWPQVSFILAYIDKDKTLLDLGSCLYLHRMQGGSGMSSTTPRYRSFVKPLRDMGIILPPKASTGKKAVES